jgi:two-component system KDP operon response regulator KdpE
MDNSGFVVLIIEDDPPIRRFLRTSLRSKGFTVFTADTGELGLVEVEFRKPDVVILDLGLPDMEGVEVVKTIRVNSELPIIILSARSSEQSKMMAFEAGANDYLTKPFSFDELLARIRVALRYSYCSPGQKHADVFINANLKVDLLNRLVSVNDIEIHLTPIQYRLLLVMVKHAGKVLTQHYILNEVWGESSQDKTHYLRIYMSQLRHKLETDPTQPKFLITESGVGYRLKVW